MIKIVEANEIININKKYASGVLLRQSIESIYSSYYYYETDEEQICSIFQNLIKGHYFTDGNKRTSVILLITLVRLNNMKTRLTDENLFDFTIKVAESNMTIEEIAKLVF